MGAGFDLNIEKILEDWQPRHAIREIIANALDEQLLSHTREIQIEKLSANQWSIRDFGRGLSHHHLSQKENPEKLSNPHTLGKFGIGLKDALGVLFRYQVDVAIQSRYGVMRVGLAAKHGFEDVRTLHVFQEPSTNQAFEGTEFTVTGVPDEEVAAAKSFFLKFSGDLILDETKYGAILKTSRQPAPIYVNGVRVAEEENFLFGYDVRAPNAALRKALNRERNNVGRVAYQARVRDILLQTRSQDVARALAADLRNLGLGTHHDELQWLDVQEHAVRILNTTGKYVFLSGEELQQHPDVVDEIHRGGKEVVTVPSNLAERIARGHDISGGAILGLVEFQDQFDASFRFEFVDTASLTIQERLIFEQTERILALVGGRPTGVKQVLISETMRPESGTFLETGGVYEPEQRRVIIKRSMLHDLRAYAGTLLHEAAHAASNRPDVDRDFESKLSEFLGTTAATSIGFIDPPSGQPDRLALRRQHMKRLARRRVARRRPISGGRSAASGRVQSR